MKESWMELVLTKLTQLPKDFSKFAMLTKLLLVNTRNYFWVSIYRDGLANEGFSYFGILSQTNLSIGSIELWWWILIILFCISANLTIWKIYGQVVVSKCVRCYEWIVRDEERKWIWRISRVSLWSKKSIFDQKGLSTH